MKVAIVLFDGAEELDYCGPYEVFSLANRCVVQDGGDAPFSVYTIGEHAGIIKSAGGLRVVPDATIDDAEQPDLLIVPGGMGTRRGSDIDPVVDYIAKAAEKAEIVASVCTGSLLLARAGLLKGLSATTHWASLDLLRKHSGIEVVDKVKFVDQGRILTAAGISAGIDLSLHLVGRLCGESLAKTTAHRMEYSY